MGDRPQCEKNLGNTEKEFKIMLSRKLSKMQDNTDRQFTKMTKNYNTNEKFKGKIKKNKTETLLLNIH